MVFENKIFTPIKNYPDYFICKETTEVLSIKPRKNTKPETKKVLKQVNNSKDPSNNYFIVTLVDSSGSRSNKSVHRLMAETFIPNPENKNHVNHIDGNKLNNMLSNLEWSTEKENSQHAVDTGLTTFEFCEKQVHQYTLSGKYLNTFKSDAEAERQTSVTKQNISKVTLGLRTQAGGYQWKREKHEVVDKVTDKIVKQYIVLDTNTNLRTFLTKLKHVEELTSSARSGLIYKFKKSDTITVKHFQITKIYFD